MHQARSRSAQQGVVLIIAMILLVVISLLALSSVRNVASNEAVMSNVRTNELATQAAEIALRHCEASTLQAIAGSGSYVTTFTASNILSTSTTPVWQTASNWDAVTSSVFVLPLSLVNQTGMTTTYNRPPECMVAPLPVMVSGSTTVNTTTSFVVTARGFGPEVAAADASRSRPQGTEVWLQSTINLQ